MHIEKFLPVFKALSNERRIEIFKTISDKIFISKSELADIHGLNRASLNHHLRLLLNAELINEHTLILDGRKQKFIIPRVDLNFDSIFDKRQEYDYLLKKLHEWQSYDLTIKTWAQLREEFETDHFSSALIHRIENRLFPLIGRNLQSVKANYCIVCRKENPDKKCAICQNPICKTHIHLIKRKDATVIELCPNCVERFFG